MFVFSLKARKLKAVALSLLCAVVLGGALTFIIHGDGNGADLATASLAGRNVRFDGIKDAGDVEKFAQSLGIEIKVPALKSVKVDLPRVFDAVYARYNDIQRQQGFDLTKYCGKTVERYTYEMTNYPLAEESTSKVYLTLLKYKDRIVGGDISSKDGDGFVTTFMNFRPQ